MLTMILTPLSRTIYALHCFLFGRKATEHTRLALQAIFQGDVQTGLMYLHLADKAAAACIAGDFRMVARDAEQLVTLLRKPWR